MVFGKAGLRVLLMSTTLALGTTALPALAQDCEVKVGAVGPLSGGAAAWGLAVKDATEFVAELHNSEGGLQVGDQKCRVNVVSFDSQYTAAGGAAAANFMASESVHIIVGPVGSPETTGFRPVAARSGIVNFSQSYMRDVISPDFPLAFHLLQAPITWGPLLIKSAHDQFGFESVVITAPNDQGGADAGEQLKAMYTAEGVNASTEYFQRGTGNFAAIAARIMNANPDAVEMSGMPPGDAAILVKQLLEGGYEGVIGSLGGTGLGPIVEGAGGVENLKNVYWLEVAPMDSPGVVKMREEYARIMGKEAPSVPTFPADVTAAEVVLQGISAAGTDQDGEKIAEALRNLTPESRFMGKAGWRGKSLYGINQELTFPTGLGMIVGGERKPTKVIEIEAE